jgi:FAD/FMN-containing dehydrogenase
MHMPRGRVQRLAGAVSGEVLTSDDGRYDEARSTWNGRFDRRPELIVRCRSAEDVRSCVGFARQERLPLSVKGGGHAYAGQTVADGGLLIDVSPMNQVEVDGQARTARVQAGARLGDLDARTQAVGLAASTGTVSTVGIAGLTLGGGSGWLSRMHGLAVDNLLAATVVTADGRIVRASASEHADLFWALRGAGANFGVVTSFEFRLHPLGPEVLSGQIVFPFDRAASVLRAWREFMKEAEDEIQCYAFVLRIPPIPEFPHEAHGQIAVDLVLFHPDPSAQDVFRPLLDLEEPILAFAVAQPYMQLQQTFDAGLPKGQRYESRSRDLAELPDEAIEAFVARIGDLPGEFTMAYIGANGGAIGRVDARATAFAGRRAPFAYHVLSGWTDRSRDATIAGWTRDIHQAMAPWDAGTVYVNLLGTDEQARVPAAYGDNYQRLVELKRTWDPDNLFRTNHNIR